MKFDIFPDTIVGVPTIVAFGTFKSWISCNASSTYFFVAALLSVVGVATFIVPSVHLRGTVDAVAEVLKLYDV